MAETRENTFHFELVSPERLVMDVDADSVLVPGAEGDFMVLADHAPMISTIRPGVLAIRQGKGEEERIFIRGGFAEVTHKTLVVLAEEAIPVKELSKSDLKERIKNAEEDLEIAKTDEGRRAAREAIARLTELLEAVR